MTYRNSAAAPQRLAASAQNPGMPERVAARLRINAKAMRSLADVNAGDKMAVRSIDSVHFAVIPA